MRKAYLGAPSCTWRGQRTVQHPLTGFCWEPDWPLRRRSGYPLVTRSTRSPPEWSASAPCTRSRTQISQRRRGRGQRPRLDIRYRMFSIFLQFVICCQILAESYQYWQSVVATHQSCQNSAMMNCRKTRLYSKLSFLWCYYHIMLKNHRFPRQKQ